MTRIGKILLSAMLIASFWGCAAKAPQIKTELPSGEKESVYFAGDISFMGNAGDIRSNYKYLSQIIDEDESLRRFVYDSVKNSEPNNVEFVKDQYGELTSAKGTGGRNVTVVLAMDRERISTMKIGDIDKVVAQISGQIVAMDFNTASVIAMLPVNVISMEIFHGKLTEEMKKVLIKKTFVDVFLKQFKEKLKYLTTKSSDTKTAKIGQVILGEKSFKRLDASGESPDFYKARVASAFASSITEKCQMPLLPYSEDQSIGNMELAISDKTVSLTIPEATYEFILTIQGYRVSLSEPKGQQRIASFVTYANITAVNKDSEKIIVDSDFAVVDTSNELVKTKLEDLDVWTSLFDSTATLADEFAANINDPKSKWLNSATRKDQNKKEIKKQLKELSIVLKTCQ